MNKKSQPKVACYFRYSTVFQTIDPDDKVYRYANKLGLKVSSFLLLDEGYDVDANTERLKCFEPGDTVVSVVREDFDKHNSKIIAAYSELYSRQVNIFILFHRSQLFHKPKPRSNRGKLSLLLYLKNIPHEKTVEPIVKSLTNDLFLVRYKQLPG